ncbi:MAG: hypothetical protein AAGA56_16980 [Myxococcota bacterium]
MGGGDDGVTPSEVEMVKQGVEGPSEEELDRFGRQIADEVIQQGRAELGDSALDWDTVRLMVEWDLLVTDEARAELRRAYVDPEVEASDTVRRRATTSLYVVHDKGSAGGTNEP